MRKILIEGGNICVVLFGGLMLAPVLVTFLKSFHGAGDYLELFFECPDFYRAFWNSTCYSVVITLLQMVIAVLCAFGFSQMTWRGKHFLILAYIILMMMPLQVTLLPNYIGLRDLKLLDTPFSIILPSIFQPIGVIVIYQYMKNINTSIIDAVRLETNSIGKMIGVAVVPQIRTSLLAVGLYLFAESWNMLEQPMLFLKNKHWQTLPMFLSNSAIYEERIMYPASVIFLIPVLLLFFKFNKYLEEGFTIGELL